MNGTFACLRWCGLGALALDGDGELSDPGEDHRESDGLERCQIENAEDEERDGAAQRDDDRERR